MDDLNHRLDLSADEQACLAALDGQMETAQQTLIDWSHVNSGSRNPKGLAKMRTLLKGAFEDLPGNVQIVDLPSSQVVRADGITEDLIFEPALLVTVRPKAPLQIVLTGHYDTVFPEDSHFQTTKHLGPDELGGPGVADMKGGILVMLNALRAFENTPDAKHVGYSILLSPDEEIGSPGSAPMLAKLAKTAHIGLTYEPALADGSMAGARKGSGNFTLLIRGKAAHAGREHHLGRNAINAAAKFAVALDALNGQREGVTFNLSKIDGGGATNIVPELAIARFNVRMPRTEDQDWIQTQIKALAAQIRDMDGITAELSGGFSRPPKPMAPANAMVFDWVKQAGSALGLDIKWAPSGGVCEGNNLWASGCPNVDTLGVRGGHIHSDREFVVLSSLKERARLSALILMRIASGAFDIKAAKALAAPEQKEPAC